MKLRALSRFRSTAVAALCLTAGLAACGEAADIDAAVEPSAEENPVDDGTSEEGATAEPIAEAGEADPEPAPATEAAPDLETDGGAQPSASPPAETAVEGDLPPSDHLGSYTLADEEFGTVVTVSVGDDTRTIESNSLPDHETGDFPNGGNPNAISEQALSYEFPLDPVWVGDATFAQTPGVAVNGVPFEPGTAETLTCASGESYRIEAVQDVYDLGLDFNNAHVQPTGKYHYHGVSELLVDAYASDEDLVHVGFAADGYLLYYSKSGAYSSSYRLDTDPRSGSGCVASGPGNDETFDVDGTQPDGTYDLDWVYLDGAGGLDRCNGATIDGEYVYVVTDEYPYIPRCLNGEATGGRQGGGQPGQDGQGGQPAGQPGQGAPQNAAPDLTVAAATLGITLDELQRALGAPPPDVEAAAATLGITAEELQAALDAARTSQPSGE